MNEDKSLTGHLHLAEVTAGWLETMLAIIKQNPVGDDAIDKDVEHYLLGAQAALRDWRLRVSEQSGGLIILDIEDDL